MIMHREYLESLYSAVLKMHTNDNTHEGRKVIVGRSCCDKPAVCLSRRSARFRNPRGA